MGATVIDGKALADRYAAQLKTRVDRLLEKGIQPRLAVILAGDNPASEVYVRLKQKRAAELGIKTDAYVYDSGVSEQTLIDCLAKLNADSGVHGILVQLPLPEQIDAQSVLAHVLPEKDVDGIHPYNAGALICDEAGFVACTPKAVLALIQSTGESVEGKNAVVVGRSRMVGKPAALLLLQNDATVTLCHSKTRDLGSVTKTADILVCAVGRPGLITTDMLKPGATIIDVGTTKVEGKWYGDVEFSPACEVASYITPVPGGVGPMTIIMLMENTVEAAEKKAHG